MNTPYKFVSPLDTSQMAVLKELIKTDASARARMRAHSIVLSSKGYGLDDIAEILDLSRNTVSSWIDHWEESGVESLYDHARSGAPSKLTASDIEVVKNMISEHPHSPKIILATIVEQLHKTVSLSTLKRIVKKHRFRWKRVRKSLKPKRNPEEFAHAAQDIETFKQQENAGDIALVYFDESGFSLDSSIPYAYQPLGETLEIPASQSQRLNVLGFFTTHNQLESFTFECNIDAEIAAACFDEFSKTLVKKTIVIIDNSPIHHSETFEDHLETWERRGLFLYYLPKYSPELNLIEILWRFIKYHWLPFSAYVSFTHLVKEVEDVLTGVGTRYQINFT